MSSRSFSMVLSRFDSLSMRFFRSSVESLFFLESASRSFLSFSSSASFAARSDVIGFTNELGFQRISFFIRYTVQMHYIYDLSSLIFNFQNLLRKFSFIVIELVPLGFVDFFCFAHL